MRIFSSAEYCRRVVRRMSQMAFSALSFCFVIIVPLLSYDEPNVSLIQTPRFVRLSLMGHSQYITRPPLALDRLRIQDTGEVIYELKHPFKNGTTHFVFEPLEFLAKLAALVPRPRANLTRYHGAPPMPSTEASWCPRPGGGQGRSANTQLVLSCHQQEIPNVPSRRFPGQRG